MHLEVTPEDLEVLMFLAQHFRDNCTEEEVDLAERILAWIEANQLTQ